MLNVSPATPIRAPPDHDDSQSDDVAKQSHMARFSDTPSAGEPLADVDSRELLRRWLDIDGADVIAIEEELTKRGFGMLTARLVQQFVSDDTQDRLQLVDEVLIEPGVDARPWLLLLAEDADADVRLAAVTIMATSGDKALIENAWQATIRDRDPRIAAMAVRLRERRANASPR
jgi:hypothetical protein